VQVLVQVPVLLHLLLNVQGMPDYFNGISKNASKSILKCPRPILNAGMFQEDVSILNARIIFLANKNLLSYLTEKSRIFVFKFFPNFRDYRSPSRILHCQLG